jgi:putative transposase
MIGKYHAGLVSIARACQLCGVSRSGYYAWRTRPVGRREEALGWQVRNIFNKSNKAYGTRRIKRELEKMGIVISHKKISRLMDQGGLVAKARRKTRATTNSRHEMPVAPNVLDRQFDVGVPDTVWVGDITYLATTGGWLYLAVVIDLYSRKVVGWSIGKRMTKALVLNALMMAIAIRKPCRGLVFHSDYTEENTMPKTTLTA